MRDYETSCKIDRGKTGLKNFLNVNSFVTPPNSIAAQEANNLGFAKERLSKCSSMTGLLPNFITVDFWSEGDLPQLVQMVNREAYDVLEQS
mmetsp:Transcript_58066/g.173301  ORF Transcript_58066/g.173301 Transcript_58066/m.173301 type:complete len:91 (+) Transcript_58066:1343-1615(+)